MAANDIRVLYFAWVKEITGCNEERIELPTGETTGRELLDSLSQRYPQLAVRADALNLAINQNHEPLSAAIKAGDEVALFPPVTGG